MVTKLSFSLTFIFVVLVWTIRAIGGGRTRKPHATASALDRQLSQYENGVENLIDIDISAHRLAARHYIQTDQPAYAIAHLSRLHARFPLDRQIALELGTAYLEAGQALQAAQVLRKIMNEEIKDSLTPLIGARYGRALFYIGNVRQSIEILNELHKEFPSSAEILCYMAEVEMTIDTLSDRAEKYLRKAISLDYRFIEARYLLSRYLMNTGQYAESRDSLLSLLQSNPLFGRAHSRLGMIYYYLKQFDKALGSYQTALAINPADYNTRYNLGELFLYAYNDRHKALEEFKKTISLQPKHAEAHFKIGLICLENNMLKEAALHLKDACEIQLRNTRFMLHYALALEKLNRKDEALTLYQAVTEIDPLDEVARHKMALLKKIE